MVCYATLALWLLLVVLLCVCCVQGLLPARPGVAAARDVRMQHELAQFAPSVLSPVVLTDQ